MGVRRGLGTLGCLTAIAAVQLLAAGATAAAPFQVFPTGGADPQVAVNDFGKAYVVATNFGGSSGTHYCRIARGAPGCIAGSQRELTVPCCGDYLSSWPYVLLKPSGQVYVTTYHNGTGYPIPGGMTTTGRGNFLFTSGNGGVDFGAGELIGDASMGSDEILGPGDSISALTDSENGFGQFFQNQPIGSYTGSTSAAELRNFGADPPAESVDGNLALIAGRPIALLQHGSNVVLRQYDGSGPVNDVANWTSETVLGAGQAGEIVSTPSGAYAVWAQGAPATKVVASPISDSLGALAIDSPLTVFDRAGGELDAFADGSGRIHVALTTTAPDPFAIHFYRTFDSLDPYNSLGPLKRLDDAGLGFGGTAGVKTAMAAAPDGGGFQVWNHGQQILAVPLESAQSVDADGNPLPPPPPPPPPPPGSNNGSNSSSGPGSQGQSPDLSAALAKCKKKKSRKARKKCIRKARKLGQ